MKKFILTETTKEYFGITLYQIKATKSFGNINEGDFGGWVEKEENLDQSGNAWVYGNARIISQRHIAWFSSVGSANGTLTAYTIKTGEIEITRGCFRGTLEEFEGAVQETHSNSQYEQEYILLIQFIRLRFHEVTIELEEAV